MGVLLVRRSSRSVDSCFRQPERKPFATGTSDQGHGKCPDARFQAIERHGHDRKDHSPKLAKKLLSAGLPVIGILNFMEAGLALHSGESVANSADADKIGQSAAEHFSNEDSGTMHFADTKDALVGSPSERFAKRLKRRHFLPRSIDRRDPAMHSWKQEMPLVMSWLKAPAASRRRHGMQRQTRPTNPRSVDTLRIESARRHGRRRR